MKRLSRFQLIGDSAEYVSAKITTIILFTLSLIMLVISASLVGAFSKAWPYSGYSNINPEDVKIDFVESIPPELFEYDPDKYSEYKEKLDTTKAWLEIIKNAEEEICIAQYYVTLLCKIPSNDFPEEIMSRCDNGKSIYDALIEAAEVRHIKVRLLIDYPNFGDQEDALSLQSHGIELKWIKFKELFSGVMHSKVLISDNKRGYVGSANMDWRALSTIKEAGIFIRNTNSNNTPTIIKDLQTIFEIYWSLGQTNPNNAAPIIPKTWPTQLAALSNKASPLNINVHQDNDTKETKIEKTESSTSQIHIGISPPQLHALGRDWDINNILSVINETINDPSPNKYIYLEAMDYIPMMVYSSPQTIWPAIDNALRHAAKAGVSVYLTINPANRAYDNNRYYKMLSDAGINVGIFCVPYNIENFPDEWDHINLTHSKIISTKHKAIITTSNYSGDYFESTAGVSVVVNDTNLVDQLHKIAYRNIKSRFYYPFPIFESYNYTCPKLEEK